MTLFLTILNLQNRNTLGRSRSTISIWCIPAGNDDELADWAAFQTATASAWKRGWAKGTLKEWGHDLLQKVLFKVSGAQYDIVLLPVTGLCISFSMIRCVCSIHSWERRAHSVNDPDLEET